MSGASWHTLDEGRRLRAALAVESYAWRGWQRRAERLHRQGLYGYMILRRIGREPDRYMLPGGIEGDRVWLPRHVPGARCERSEMHERAPLLEMAGEMRPYQEEAVQAWRAARGRGVVVCPCGAGKTVMALSIIARTPSPALVLVHTIDLVRQWCERIESYLPGVEIGIVGGGAKPSHGRITVATVQTLQRWSRGDLEAWGARYGLVVADECHHIPAASWTYVVSCLAGPWRLGLSATPARVDGLEDWIYWTMGPRVATIEQAELQDAGAVIVPLIRYVRTGWDLPRDCDGKRWDHICRMLACDVTRNAVIVESIREQVARGRIVLALVGLVDHARALAVMCGGEVLVGETPTADRARILADIRARRCSVVVATTVADEGLDLPEVDTVALCWPEHRLSQVEQRIGRALRPAPGKQAEILDYCDCWKPLLGWSQKRKKLYREKGWNNGNSGLYGSRRGSARKANG